MLIWWEGVRVVWARSTALPKGIQMKVNERAPEILAGVTEIADKWLLNQEEYLFRSSKYEGNKNNHISQGKKRSIQKEKYTLNKKNMIIHKVFELCQMDWSWLIGMQPKI